VINWLEYDVRIRLIRILFNVLIRMIVIKMIMIDWNDISLNQSKNK